MQSAASSLVNEAVNAKATRKTQPRKNPVTAEPVKSNALNFKSKRPAITKASVVQEHTTKQEAIVAMLGRKDGATIANIMSSTGWQMHSVRGFLAGTVKKKLGLKLISSKEKGEERTYRIASRGR